MTIEERLSQKGEKIYYRFVWGKGAGNQVGAGAFSYTNFIKKA